MDELEKILAKGRERKRYKLNDKALKALGYKFLRETPAWICYETKDGYTRIIVNEVDDVYTDRRKHTVEKTQLKMNMHEELYITLTWDEIEAVADLIRSIKERDSICETD